MRFLKKLYARRLGTLLLLMAFCACRPAAATQSVPAPQRVVALLGSYAEAWMLAGGTLAGATDDAMTERKMSLGADVRIVGTTKAPHMERIIDIEPDLVLFSTDVCEQTQAAAALAEMGIHCRGFSVTTYGEYLDMMETLCALTGREDLYLEQSRTVREPIESMCNNARNDPRFGKRTALLLRAYSTGVKAKGSDNMAGAMLSDMGLNNMADGENSLLESLTLEAIVEADPDYIFVVTMGKDDEKTMAALAESLTDNPAWAGLTAVREGRYVRLDKMLFHYKPNARWAESYAFLYALLYDGETG